MEKPTQKQIYPDQYDLSAKGYFVGEEYRNISGGTHIPLPKTPYTMQ